MKNNKLQETELTGTVYDSESNIELIIEPTSDDELTTIFLKRRVF